MAILRGVLLRAETSEQGFLGEVLLIEPNGDEYPIHCLVKDLGTEISGDAEHLDYLNKRYGEPEVCFTARETVLGTPLG